MSEVFKNRQQALETEYIRRREREGLERLRAEMRAQSEGATATAGLRCPRDGSEMVAVMMDAVQVDRCAECGGLWLDAGELEHLTNRGQGGDFFDRMRRTIAGK